MEEGIGFAFTLSTDSGAVKFDMHGQKGMQPTMRNDLAVVLGNRIYAMNGERVGTQASVREISGMDAELLRCISQPIDGTLPRILERRGGRGL